MTLQITIAEENEDLRTRVRYLEKLLIPHDVDKFPAAWKLTHSQREMLGLVLKHKTVSREQIMHVLWGDRTENVPNEKTVHTLICFLRKKLKPIEVTIATVWGVGYAMPDSSKAKLRRLMETENASASRA